VSFKQVAVGLGMLASLWLVAPMASADVPGPRQVCDTEGLTCGSCWDSYGQCPADAPASACPEEAEYDKCITAQLAKGYVEACREQQGSGENVYYCPPGTQVQTVTKGGGCGGCSLGSSTTSGALLALAFGLSLLVARRRERS
jgi:MYXO-CTERM domain-containing protein